MNTLATLTSTAVAVPTRLASLAGSTATAPAPAAPEPPQDAVHLNPAARAMQATGLALARVGGLAGSAIGAGVGLALNLAGGGALTSLMLPALGALAVGFACADARGSRDALHAGVSSPEFQKRVQAHRTQTPISSGCIALTTAAGVGSIAAGIGLVGGPVGLVAGVGGALAASLALGITSFRSERALLAAQAPHAR